jgi:anti-anti-sigma factor
VSASQGSETPGARPGDNPPLLSPVRPPAEPGPAPAPHFSIVIGRQRGTVVVTVHGELDMTRAGHLGNILADLIDGQGNLSVVVDLHDAVTNEPDSLLVFTDAAERARRRGGTVLLNEPHPTLGEALQLRGLDHFIGTKTE